MHPLPNLTHTDRIHYEVLGRLIEAQLISRGASPISNHIRSRDWYVYQGFVNSL